MNAPTFTVIAGINGAGKTSLYRVISADTPLGERINTDEIAFSLGSVNDPLTQIKASRIAIKKIGEYIASKTSFHIETTLPGQTVEKYVRRAKENGFRIVLYFVGIDDVSVAINRVHRRIANGGHGIADSYILKRYGTLNDNLRLILPYCDDAYLFDNTLKFRQVAYFTENKLADCDSSLPLWFIELMDTQNANDSI